MKVKFKNSVSFCFLLVLISCGSNQEEKGKNIGDVSFLLHTYNTQIWADYLSGRDSKDSLLSEYILETSVIIGSLAREIGTESGGLNEDGSLSNPLAKNPIQTEDLEKFYEKLSDQLSKVKSLEGHEIMDDEVDKVLGFMFFDQEGILSKRQLSSMNVVNAVSNLFILENFCYYLVVKYC
ncbi:MAG: hypothetical protein RIG77_11055 [Cyclobacteriaceae bacterium]